MGEIVSACVDHHRDSCYDEKWRSLEVLYDCILSVCRRVAKKKEYVKEFPEIKDEDFEHSC